MVKQPIGRASKAEGGFGSLGGLIRPDDEHRGCQSQTGEQGDRTLLVDNETVPYFANIIYPMLAIFTGLPSTAFPAGLDPQGLPLAFVVM